MCSDNGWGDYDCTFTCQMDPDSIATVIEVTVTDTSNGMTIQSNGNVLYK